MAETPDEVVVFLRDLAARARPFAQRDLAELKAFAASELNLPELSAWDMAFAAEKLREKRYAFSDQEVKQYFQLPRVLSGLFAQVEKLFSVNIKRDQAGTWHDSVEFYRIERNGRLLGQFYLDLFARETKRPGAWMNGARSRAKRLSGTQSPIAYLVCNFQPPVGDQPGLLTHNDLTTLFHEFGHGRYIRGHMTEILKSTHGPESWLQCTHRTPRQFFAVVIITSLQESAIALLHPLQPGDYLVGILKLTQYAKLIEDVDRHAGS